MSKAVHPDVLDAALGVIRQATRMVALAEQPADLAAANAARLAETPLGVADFTGGARPGGGRRMTVAAKSGVSAIAAGTASHVALLDASRLLYVTTCPAQPVAEGAALSFAPWDVEIGDPV